MTDTKATIEHNGFYKVRPTVKGHPTEVVMLTRAGEWRVLQGKAGMLFLVDSVTIRPDGGIVRHVRDYRYEQNGKPYQIWSLGPDDCTSFVFQPEEANRD